MQYRLRLAPAFLAPFVLLVQAAAQIGGNGSDGHFTPTRDLTLQQGRTYHFESVTIPANVTVTLRGSAPYVFLSRGDVIVAGTLDASAYGGKSVAGPGGFAGGSGGRGTQPNPGQGPGGGSGGQWQVCGCIGYPRFLVGRPGSHRGSYGASYPFDLRGGSGGEAGASQVSIYPPTWWDGGGGGGTIAILADGRVRISGSVRAQGSRGSLGFYGAMGGSGAGGSILLRGVRGVVVQGVIDARGVETGSTADDGYVRLDAYAQPPRIEVGGYVQPPPEALELPELRVVGPTVIGGTLRFTMATLPGDVLAVAAALRQIRVPFPPYGVLRLDPAAGVLFLGTALTPVSGIDPIASLVLPIPHDQALVGLRLYVQAMNLLTATNFPRLTNLATLTIARG